MATTTASLRLHTSGSTTGSVIAVMPVGTTGAVLAGFVGQELQPVEVTLGSDLSDRLTVRLDRTDREALARQAKTKGVGPSTLARMWLKERLRQEVDAEASAR